MTVPTALRRKYDLTVVPHRAISKRSGPVRIAGHSVSARSRSVLRELNDHGLEKRDSPAVIHSSISGSQNFASESARQLSRITIRTGRAEQVELGNLIASCSGCYDRTNLAAEQSRPCSHELMAEFSAPPERRNMRRLFPPWPRRSPSAAGHDAEELSVPTPGQS